MVRSMVIGKYWQIGERVKGKRVKETLSPSPVSLFRCVRKRTGFTLLELMIVITVIVILAAIVLPQFQKTILASREAVLREDLSKLRMLIDQYASDKQKLPQNLEELVAAGYIRDVPKDPITGNADWALDIGEDTNLPDGGQGLLNVHSSSPDTASDGTLYSSW
jgi:general secretion pathway protein G